jgi:hypothetical protein
VGSAPTLLGSRQAITGAYSSGEVRSFDWRTVESADYKQYITNLRSIGCPEETIRDIIIADVNKLFEGRKQGFASTNRFLFWKGGQFVQDLLNEHLRKSRETDQEKRLLIKELLGEEVAERSDSSFDANEILLDFLTPEQRASLRHVDRLFASKLIKAQDQQRNPDLMRQIYREKEAELSKLLSPKEKEEYDLRMSHTAIFMRAQMGAFEPTEQEFRRIFNITKQFDDEFKVPGAGLGKAEDRERRDAAGAEMNRNLRDVLGEERYREYFYEQQWMTGTLKDVAEQFAIPKESALKVIDIKLAAEEQAARIYNDASLTASQRDSLRNTIHAETVAAITRTLGSGAGEAYAKRSSWIKALEFGTGLGSR